MSLEEHSLIETLVWLQTEIMMIIFINLADAFNLITNKLGNVYKKANKEITIFRYHGI